MKFVASIATLLALSAVEASKLRSREHVAEKVAREKEHDSRPRMDDREHVAEKVATGKEHAPRPRMDDGPSLIVGGSTTAVNEFPYYVDLDGCGGSLIAPGVVLTAAHCAVDDGFTYVGETVIVGGYHRQQESHGAVKVGVTAQAPHPMYDIESSFMDIMLLKLETRVTTKGDVKLVLNRQFSTPSDGQILTAIGTGDTSEGGTQSDQILQVDLPSFNYEACNEVYGGEVDHDAMMCAGGVENQDSCQGDSGGPIVIRNGNTHTQVGVTSWGEGCARKDIPGVYARVSAGKEFIAFVVCECWGIRDSGFCSAESPSSTFQCPSESSSNGNSGSGSGGNDDGGTDDGGDDDGGDDDGGDDDDDDFDDDDF
ncbi:MAG: hypothetical protein SGBAC_011832 [Bacillariaceae sp.]